MRRLVLLLLALTLVACSKSPAKSPESALQRLRRVGPVTRDADTAGQWLMAELLAPGGDAQKAARARARLDELGGGDMVAHTARGLDDTVHGNISRAPESFLKAVEQARSSTDPRAPLIAWFAANRATQLMRHDSKLWKDWKPFVEKALAAPGGIGWRARGELAGWWTDEAWESATQNADDLAAKKYGCAENVRLAGPFGRGTQADPVRHYAAERPGPWPQRWSPEPGYGSAPRILDSERFGCAIVVNEPISHGLIYAETYLDLPAERELILAQQSALQLWVDDHLVLDRDVRKWGVWPKFGVQVRLSAGRHRVLAKVGDVTTSLRVMKPDGTPANVKTSTDPAPGYQLVPPTVTRDPNPLSPWVKSNGVRDSKDDLTRFLVAYLAHIEGQDDVASVAIEPLVEKPDAATGTVLHTSAVFVEQDPLFEESQARDLERELNERAVRKDPKLWAARLSVVAADAQSKGISEAVKQLRKLAKEFPDVPEIAMALARIYREMGWSAERSTLIKSLVDRFPNNVEILGAAIDVFDSEGAGERADELVARVKELDPDTEIVLLRALARRDYQLALKELKRLGERRPDRKDIAERIYDVTVRAGNAAETFKKLEAAVKKEPQSAAARLALADARFAAGHHDALRKALADAVEAGADTEALSEAIDLVEGVTELGKYRIDGKDVIAAYEKRDQHMAGTAARVLDYAVVWVHADGGSRMLEHEIIRVQSAEAIRKFAEHPPLAGIVLNMRVIKQDGSTLEPEIVPGKPTVTFPHLEVGDYIETEHVMTNTEGSERGARYLGPRWFFREESVAYDRSEFVVVSPSNRELTVETRGNVPEPKVTDADGVIVRRWRVDRSPAAPVEPGSTPITEFLPSVRVGWGITEKFRLQRLADSAVDVSPVDPRIARIAARIVEGAPKSKPTERARRAYRWILGNVEEGEEQDGRRVIVSKQGNRWRGFLTLCAALGIDVDYVITKSKLAPPPVGPIERAAQWGNPVLRLKGKSGPVWLTVGSKYAPFGYVPESIRGQPGYLLADGDFSPTEVPEGGQPDMVQYSGVVRLASDGSAKIDLVQTYHGRFAMLLRQGFANLPERRMHDVIEARLLGSSLRGARLVAHRIENRDDLDTPLSIRMQAEMATFARTQAGGLVISPPFAPRVSQLAALPERQTPLLIGDSTHQKVELRIELPAGSKVTAHPAAKLDDAGRTLTVNDRVDGNALVLERELHLPAGRVQPDEYADFVRFARKADEAMNREYRVAP